MRLSVRESTSALFDSPRRTLVKYWFGLSDKVKLLSPHHRFVIALHSPDEDVETGLLGRRPEKEPQSPSAGFISTLSLVRFEGVNREVGPFSRNSRSNPGGFLCTS